MAYFRNTAVNLLNLHYAIHALVMSGTGAFYAVYLLRAGVSAPGVLAALAAIFAGRFFIRPLILPIAVRVGLKPLVIAGTIISGIQFPLMAEVQGLGWPLIAMCAAASLGDTIYWTSYHAYFASIGDTEHRGHQTAIREAIVAIVGIVAPLLTGWMLVVFGPRIAFGVTTAMMLASAAPLFFTPQIPVLRDAPGALRAAYKGTLIFAADAWTFSFAGFTWQIAMFVSLGQDFMAFGGAVALAALVGAIAGLALGRWIDLGHGARAVRIVLAFAAATTIAKALAYTDAHAAVAVNAFAAIVAVLYVPTVMTAVYNDSKTSPCPLRFHMATEGGFDAGAATGCLLAAAVIALGAPFGAAILISLLGSGAMFLLLRNSYAAVTPAIVQTAPAAEQ